MRHVLLLALAFSALGCASKAQLLAERQACIECALREHDSPETLPDAEAKFTRWCAEGDARSCSVLGVMFENGRGVVADPGKAARLYGRACRGGNAPACVSLGRMMEAGTAARPDPEGAIVMYEAACDAGELAGCEQLGRTLADIGRLRLAAKVLGSACKRGHAASCETLGTLVAEGRGVARSERRAQELFRRACRGGHANACARL